MILVTSIFEMRKRYLLERTTYFALQKLFQMTERELIKLEGTIRKKMEDIKKQRVSLKDSGIGGLMNSLKKVDEALMRRSCRSIKKW